MAHRFEPGISGHRITPPDVFFGRREFLAALGWGVLSAPRAFSGSAEQAGLLEPPYQRPDRFPARRSKRYDVPAAIPRRTLTPREVAASHNNFYEFLPGRGGPAWKYAGDFKVEPWKVEVTGECQKPVTLDLDDLLRFELEERVYHFRCVERWAMNVPWTGFPLRKLLEKVEPKSKATHVRFVSAKRPEQMPGVKEASYYPWPYHEGLRMDEAMNELALIVTGVYGQPLLKQHGAPVRIIVPWKYGYKNPKSVVKIELVRKEPKTFWEIQPHEYGFLSNVNPNIPHPRWSQARSYWLDNQEPFPTPIFNGYETFVASLYPDEPREPRPPLRPGQMAR